MQRIETTLPCEALIDQNRYIGGDPVGHWCAQPAAFEYSRVEGSNVLLCEDCARMLKEEPRRLSLNFTTPGARAASLAAVIGSLGQKPGQK